MANELTPRILNSMDTQRYEKHTGKVIPLTRIEYLLGDQGPFVYECPREEFSDLKLQEAMQQRANALRRFV